MSANLFENGFSAIVIVLAAVFLGYMLQSTGTGHLGSYGLVARMDNAAGLRVGTDVRISGMKVGRVSGLSLDPRTHSALVQLRVRDDLALPLDSTVAVTVPVMSDVELTITPGRAAGTITPGGDIGQPAKRARPYTGS